MQLINIAIGPIILGYTLQLHYVPYIMALIFIKDIKYKSIIFLLAPVLIMMFALYSNPIFDYLFTMYSFIGFGIVKISNKKYWILQITILSLFSFLLTTWWNTLSGVVFYNFTWSASLLFNSLFNFLNFIIIFPMLLFSYSILNSLKIPQIYEHTY